MSPRRTPPARSHRRRLPASSIVRLHASIGGTGRGARWPGTRACRIGRSSGRLTSIPNAPGGRIARPTRSSTSAPIPCASSFMISLAGRRCRASTRSPCAGSAKVSRKPGAIQPEGFRRTVEATRRFRAIAGLAMGVVVPASTRPRPRRSGAPATGPSLPPRSPRSNPASPCAFSAAAEEARFAALGVISGFFRPIGLVGDMGGGSLEIGEALDDRVGDNSVSLPLGALPVEALLRRSAPGEAKRRVDAILLRELAARIRQARFLRRRRRLARFRQGAYRRGRRARARWCMAIRSRPRKRAASPRRCCA